MVIIAREVTVFPRKNVITHRQIVENVLRMKLPNINIVSERGVLRIQRSDERKFIQIRSIHLLLDEVSGEDEIVSSNGALAVEIIGTTGKWVDKMIDKILVILKTMGYDENHHVSIVNDLTAWQYDCGNFGSGDDD